MWFYFLSILRGKQLFWKKRFVATLAIFFGICLPMAVSLNQQSSTSDLKPELIKTNERALKNCRAVDSYDKRVAQLAAALAKVQSTIRIHHASLRQIDNNGTQHRRMQLNSIALNLFNKTTSSRREPTMKRSYLLQLNH